MPSVSTLLAAPTGVGCLSRVVFVSERGSAFTTAGVARMIERVAAGAGLEIKSPPMLRHTCCYTLANKGHDARPIQRLARPSIDHQRRGLQAAEFEPVQRLLAGLRRRRERTSSRHSWLPHPGAIRKWIGDSNAY
jgi:site-specific recombinase XerD